MQMNDHYNSGYSSSDWKIFKNSVILSMFQSSNDFIQLMSNAQQGGKNYEKEDEKEVEQHSTNISKTG